MKEELLQFIWQYKKFNLKQLKTVEGESVIIKNCGTINHLAGPDFTNARIIIGETEWAGHVEIHVKASDWKKHGHSADDKYNSVILHVVLENDLQTFHCPTIELKDRISQPLLASYEKLMNAEQFIACEYFLPQINEFTWSNWKERLLVERLETKTERIVNSLKENKNNWQQVFYEQLAYNFGLLTNATTFEEVAKRVPLKIIGKHRQNLFQVEALLFGTAGLLSDAKEDYSQKLQKEFEFLKAKYNINPITKANWNFGRVRPAAQPTIRIAQFASLLHHSKSLFSQLMAAKTITEIAPLFKHRPSMFWETHYTFNKQSKQNKKVISKSKIENIIINSIVPFLFIYGKYQNKPELVEQSLSLLLQLKGEKNSIIKKWQNNGVSCANSFDSQALLHLYKNYCKKKNCLQCKIGHTIFTKK